MDRAGDEFGEVDEPLLKWPPTAEERAQLARIVRVVWLLVAIGILLSIALAISMGVAF